VKELSVDHSDHTLLQAGSQTAISDRMRELLARAAQDHVYEQRTQGAVLDEIRQRLEGMEWLLREVRERELGGLSGTLESVHGRLDDISVRPPAWAEGLAQHVEAVRDHVDAVGERVGSLGERVDSVRDRVTPLGELPSLWADLGTVGESVDEALTRLQTIMDGTQGADGQRKELTEHLGRLQSNMEAAAHRFTRLDRSLADLTQRAGRLESGMLDLATSVENAVDGAADRLLAAVEQMNGKIDLVAPRIDGRADALESHIDRLDGRQIAAEGRFDTIDERLDDIEGRVTSRIEVIDSRLCALDGRAEKTTERLESVDERIDRLPAILNLGDVHKNVGALLDIQTDGQGRRFDSLDERVTQAEAALAPLADLLRAQPDRAQLADALGAIVEPVRTDLTRRLGALEETMLALAEALLRPTRTDKD
jgi:phage shock protein A